MMKNSRQQKIVKPTSMLLAEKEGVNIIMFGQECLQGKRLS